MASPVKFADLGKDAKDLLSKNFHNGVLKLEAKTKSSSGVQFTVDGTHCGDTGNVLAGLEAKIPAKDFVPAITQKFTTDNRVTAKVEFDKLVQGLKVDLDCSLNPTTGKKGAVIKNTYSKDFFSGTLDLNVLDGPVVHGSAVAEHKGVLVGAQASYDTAGSKMTTNSLSLTYHGDGFKIHSGVTDLSKYFGSIYHKVNGSLQAAASVAWADQGSGPALTVGAHYAPDADSFYKVKLDNALQVGLSYTTKLADGVQVTLSSLVDGKALNGGGHQFGLSFNLSA